MPDRVLYTNCAVVERAHGEHRDSRERLSVRARTDVGRDRHLGNVELQPTHHSAKRLNDLRYFLERQLA